MNSYNYGEIDPRGDRSLYYYSEFEGRNFLRAWALNRDKLITMKIRKPDVIEPPTGLRPVMGLAFRCEDALRDCAAALVLKTYDPDILAGWAVLVGNKIDRLHRLRAKYTADGKEACDEDAGGASYAFAAYLLAWLALLRNQLAERLKWTNALLKCLDVISCTDVQSLDCLSRYCLAKAAQSERSIVQSEINRLSIAVKL